MHLTAVTAKEIANRYYAQPVAKAYWNSCSNGGRQGLIEAQRYPEDFDGIVANAPWVDQTGFTIGAIWNQRAFDETHVSADKLALVAERAMQQCDAVDGLRDGLIDDPRQCSFNVARDVPSCASGNDASATCLTPAEAAAVQKVYDGPQSGRRTIFPGFMVGSEAVLPRPNGAAGSGWLGLIAPPEAGGAHRGLRAGRRDDALPRVRSAAGRVGLPHASTSAAIRSCSNAGASRRTRPTPTCATFARAAAKC